MKRDNRGFTVIELILSFIFVFTLAFSMYQLLFSYRTRQNTESIRSQMLDYRDQVTLAIQNDIVEKNLKSIESCYIGGNVVNRCIVLNFNDNTKKKLSVEDGTVTYDGNDYDIKYIKYDNIIYQSPDAILLEFGNGYIYHETQEADEIENDITIYRISIPIYHNDLSGNYGINIVAPAYNYTQGGTSGSSKPVEPAATKTADGTKYAGSVTEIQNVNAKSQLSVIARVKFDNSNFSSNQHFFGNWAMGGFGLSLKNQKACFGTYLSTGNQNNLSYKEICSDALSADTFYTIVGVFDKASNKILIYVNGASKELAIPANSQIVDSDLKLAIGGNIGRIKNTNYFYGTISHAIVCNANVSSKVSSCFNNKVDTNCYESNVDEYKKKCIVDVDLIKK